MATGFPPVIVDYGPYRAGESPGSAYLPTHAEMDQDLQIISSIADAVRIYTVEDGQDYIVQRAAQYRLPVIPSAYLHNPHPAALDPRLTFSELMNDPSNKKELDDLVTLLNSTDLSNIPFAVIGNEAITQVGAWDASTVIDAINYVKSRVPAGVKFTTAELAGGQYYINNPSSANQTRLGQAVDVIFANIFPYWEGVSIDGAVAQVLLEYNQLKAAYPGKQVIISETGWPSGGPDVGLAHPSLQNEQKFWTEFKPAAQQNGIVYAGFEAFDEPYKAALKLGLNPEGTWGLYDANRIAKTAVTSLVPGDVLDPAPGSMRFIDTSVEAQAARLYQAAFGRAPDDAGLAYWSGPLHGGASLVDIAGGFLASAEFQSRYGNPGNTGFVTNLYQNVLHRGPDASGLAYWQSTLDSGASTRAQVLASFSESAENKADTSPSADAESAARLYWAELGRAPDSAGLTFWTSQLSNGAATLSTEADALASSPEFATRFPNLDNNGFVTQLYQNVLGRAPDASGLAAWTNALANGATRGSVVTSFSESAESKARFENIAGHNEILVV